MKQVVQDLRRGLTQTIDVPSPGVGRGSVLIRTRASLISAGTERMLVEFGQASLLGKARAQPDKIKQVLEKIRSDGLVPTLETVFQRLDEPLPLGYCNVGTVLEVGPGVTDLVPGDRVVSNGPHAEIVAVPRLLCAKVPDGIDDESAAFTVLASIGLQGVRLVEPRFGECIAVVGMGLIGLVTAQLLLASGCRVIAIDVNPDRLAIARKYGCEVHQAAEGSVVTAARAVSGGRGVDAVLITASAKTNQIVREAAQMCRQRGRIVLVGVVGLELQRSDFYEKELTFQVSCSYGPGRYDESYEGQGHDYPFGFVRWTEQRNFEAVLEALRTRRLVVDDLLTDRFPLESASHAYAKIQQDRASLGVLLSYASESSPQQTLLLPSADTRAASGATVVGVIGAGNFSKMTMLPALCKTSAKLRAVAGRSSGAAAQHLASKYNAEIATTDYREVLNDHEINAVLIATRHDSHARIVCEALAAGKHVFVEKPLALSRVELQTVTEMLRAHPQQLMVGFNRRFSPHTQWIQKRLAGRSEPLAMTFTANAGAVPLDSWVHDPLRGGGRIIGEACHFIDLMVHLTGSEVCRVAAQQMGPGVAVTEDKMAISLAFADGSIGTINYFANGSKSYPKEQLEVFSEQRTLRLDNFRRSTAYGFQGVRRFRTSRQDKGHFAQFAAFASRVSEGGPPLLPYSQLRNVALASFAAVEAARERKMIDLQERDADEQRLPASEAVPATAARETN